MTNSSKCSEILREKFMFSMKSSQGWYEKFNTVTLSYTLWSRKEKLCSICYSIECCTLSSYIIFLLYFICFLEPTNHIIPPHPFLVFLWLSIFPHSACCPQCVQICVLSTSYSCPTHELLHSSYSAASQNLEWFLCLLSYTVFSCIPCVTLLCHVLLFF